MSATAHLNELRNRRDAYIEPAVAAMAKALPAMTAVGWRKWVYDFRDKPDVMNDALQVLLPDLNDFHCWAMITRFAWLAQMTRAEEFRQLQFKRHMAALSR